jgi:hypothetical protein
LDRHDAARRRHAEEVMKHDASGWRENERRERERERARERERERESDKERER